MLLSGDCKILKNIFMQLWDMSLEYPVKHHTKGHSYNNLETRTTHYISCIIIEKLAICCKLSKIEE